MAVVKDTITSKKTDNRPIDQSLTDSSLSFTATTAPIHDDALVDKENISVDTTHSSNATASTSSWHSAISDQKEVDLMGDSLSDTQNYVTHADAFSSLTTPSTAPVAENGDNEEREDDHHRPRGSTGASEVELPDILAIDNLSSPESANASLSPTAFFDGEMDEGEVEKTALSTARTAKKSSTVALTSKKTSAVSLQSVTSSDSGIHKSPPHDAQEMTMEAENTDKSTMSESATRSMQPTAKQTSVVRMRRDERKTSVDKPPKGDKPRPASCNFSSTSSSSSFDLRMHSVSDTTARTIPLHQQW